MSADRMLAHKESAAQSSMRFGTKGTIKAITSDFGARVAAKVALNCCSMTAMRRKRDLIIINCTLHPLRFVHMQQTCHHSQESF